MTTMELMEEAVLEAPKAARPELLNLGCGRRFHPDWVNVDFVSTSADVMAYDLRRGIPFDESRFDVVYHSHVLEHFSEPAGLQFLQECHRVTKPGGLIRVAVPDLERIAKTYLGTLQEALSGSTEAAQNYRWMKLELLDQLARGESGGEMRKYLEDPGIPNAEFVLERLGTEARGLIDRDQVPAERAVQKVAPRPPRKSIWQRIRERVVRVLLGPEYAALQLGRFRLGGEVHLWMYDRYSLGAALQEAGYVEPVMRAAGKSLHPNWAQFELDTERDGTTYKPDSLFMEARKA